MAGLSSQKLILSGDATGLLVQNISEGAEVLLRVSGALVYRDFTFCSGNAFIHFVGESPTTLPSGKIGLLAIKSFGSESGDCVAAFAVED